MSKIEDFDLDQIFEEINSTDLKHFRGQSGHSLDHNCTVCKLGKLLTASEMAKNVVNILLSKSPKIYKGQMVLPLAELPEMSDVYIAEQEELIKTIKTLIILGMLAGRIMGRSEALEFLVPND